MTALLMLMGVAAQGAQAQTSRPPGWEFSVTPYGWFAGLSGSTQTPLQRFPGRDFSADFGSILSDVSAIPVMGMAEVRYGRFGVVGDLLYLGLSTDLTTHDVAFRGGEASVNTTIGSVVGFYRILDLPNQDLDIGAGARIWAASVKLTLNAGQLPGTIQKTSTSWADPVLAARYRLGLSDRVGVTVYGDIGGFGAGSVLTWQAMGSLDYQASESIVLRAGWRYMTFERQRGDFTLDLGFNGPFVAATFRF